MKTIALLIACFILTGVHCCFAQKNASNKPNIIYILTDDLGYGDVSCFNPQGQIKTVSIDRIAAEGMKFTDAHSSSAVCTPSRYSILTGRYCWRTSLKSNVLDGDSKALIEENRLTVADVLKHAGYSTAVIGKWHLGWNWEWKNSAIDFSKPVTKSPLVNGFDYAFVLSASLDMPPYVYVENGKPTAVPNQVTEDTGYQTMWRKGPTAPDFVHDQVTPEIFKRAFQYIHQQSKNKKPFFLYLPLTSPHTPILPTDGWLGKSGLNPYADFVLMVDTYIGQLQQVMKEAGIDQNTLLVFASDNGCSPRANYKELTAKGHNPSYIYRGAKADIFEGGHRIPFIIKWPGVIKPGTVCNKTTSLMDFIATCASVVHYPLPADAAEDSYDLTALFKKPSSKQYKRAYTIHHSINGSFAIRHGDWKLILCPDSGGWSDPSPAVSASMQLPPFQLYNLKNDPGEKNNLYGKYPAIEKKLLTEITKEIKLGRSTPGPAQKNNGDSTWLQVKWIH